MRPSVVARLSQLVACPHSVTFSHTKCPQSKLQYFQFLRTTLASHCNAMHCGSTFLQLQSWPDGGHSGIRNSSLNLTRWILARETHPKPRSMLALIANNQLKYPERTWVLLCWDPAGKTLNSNGRYPY